MKTYLKALILISSLWFAPLHAHDLVVSRVVSVYDADTFRVDVAGWPHIIGENMPIRVLGVDAPEIRGKCQDEKVKARLAKVFTKEKLSNAKTIELRSIKRGKYFRILADVYVDSESLSFLLIKEGHGRPYNGGKRLGWCK